jgi:hypothetical protein
MRSHPVVGFHVASVHSIELLSATLAVSQPIGAQTHRSSS